MPPVSVCHQLSWMGRPSARCAPDHRLGVERLADAGDEAQPRQIVAPRQLGAGLHQHADRGRRRVPDADPLAPARIAYQRSASKSASSTMLVTPLVKRRDDAVRGAGHPAGIGGAPEDVVGVEVEREPAGHVVRDDGAVHVQRALGLAGGAAGEVQQRRLLRIGRRDGEVGAGASARSAPKSSVPAGSRPVADDEHVLELRAARRAAPRPSLRRARAW